MFNIPSKNILNTLTKSMFLSKILNFLSKIPILAFKLFSTGQFSGAERG